MGYTTTCNTVRKINKEAKEAYIRQEHVFGEVCELDWGKAKLNIAGKNKTLQMSVFTTASFFEEVGGVYKEMVYDNARVMVAKFVDRSEKEPTEALLKLS
ncbi:MAG: hypothetical protein KAX30_00160 [Candidatus Atribacteria bacterium]|nr:hypothetical protein [Candidatus Atribacteria bacterium]